MKPETNDQFTFSAAFKEKLIHLVIYVNQSAKELTKSYHLPNVQILLNWITYYKKKLEKEAITLDIMGLAKK